MLILINLFINHLRRRPKLTFTRFYFYTDQDVFYSRKACKKFDNKLLIDRDSVLWS